MQGTLEEREAQLQAAQSAVDFLTSQCKDQEGTVQSLQAQLAQVNAQLLEVQNDTSKTSAMEELEAKVAALSAVLAASEQEARSALATASSKSLQDLANEALALRARVGELEARVAEQQVALAAGGEDAEAAVLDMEALRAEVDSSQQLKVGP